VAKRINSRVLDTQYAGHAHIMNEDGVDVMQRANIDEDRRASPPFTPRHPHASTRVSRLPHVALHHSVCRCCIGLYRWPCHGGKGQKIERTQESLVRRRQSCPATCSMFHCVIAETRRVTQLNGCLWLCDLGATVVTVRHLALLPQSRIYALVRYYHPALLRGITGVRQAVVPLNTISKWMCCAWAVRRKGRGKY
jgi:hypothetical protein